MAGAPGQTNQRGQAPNPNSKERGPKAGRIIWKLHMNIKTNLKNLFVLLPILAMASLLQSCETAEPANGEGIRTTPVTGGEVSSEEAIPAPFTDDGPALTTTKKADDEIDDDNDDGDEEEDDSGKDRRNPGKGTAKVTQGEVPDGENLDPYSYCKGDSEWDPIPSNLGKAISANKVDARMGLYEVSYEKGLYEGKCSHVQEGCHIGPAPYIYVGSRILPDGRGKFTADQYYYEGTFKEGKMVRGTWMTKDDTFVGSLDSKTGILKGELYKKNARARWGTYVFDSTVPEFRRVDPSTYKKQPKDGF